jgi:EpsD family peptidyl-prolyl cis-trans isomerase
LIRFGEPLLPGIRFSRVPRLPVLVGGVALLTVLSACNRGESPGQPVARVNGKSITAYQLGDELGRSEQAGDVSGRRDAALQELVDRELLQAEALRDRIDRDPHVAAALENARAYILAQAYLKSRAAYVRSPSRDEIRTFFDKHPEKFAKRQILHVREIVLPVTEITAELEAAMDAAKTMDDMSAWLDGRRIAHTQATRVYSSTDLPVAFSARMKDKQAGQLFVTKDENNASLLAITDIQDSPLSFEAAAPQIERMLLEKRSHELGESALAGLRAHAQVEYADKTVTQFADMQKEAASPASEKIVKVTDKRRDTAQ